MDGKYGQLYTEADVKVIAEVLARNCGVEPSDGQIDAIIKELKDSVDGPLTFPVDEPLFLLRGQDLNVRGTLEEYEVLCDENGSPDEHLERIRKARAEFQTYRDEHPDRMKLPD